MSALSEPNHADTSFSSPLRGSERRCQTTSESCDCATVSYLPRRERAFPRRVGGLQPVLCCGDEILGFGDVADGARSFRPALK